MPQSTPPGSAPGGFRQPLLAHAARDRGACRRHRRRASAQARGHGHGHLPARTPAAPDLALPEDRHAIPCRPHEIVLGIAPSARPRLRTRPFARPAPPLRPRRHRKKAAQTACKALAKPCTPPSPPRAVLLTPNGADAPSHAKAPPQPRLRRGFRSQKAQDRATFPLAKQQLTRRCAWRWPRWSSRP